jgi:hypothetical protein
MLPDGVHTICLPTVDSATRRQRVTVNVALLERLANGYGGFIQDRPPVPEVRWLQRQRPTRHCRVPMRQSAE